MSIRNLHILILVSVAYVAAQLVADISNLRNLTLFGLSVSAFSIVYPLTFTLRDMVHKVSNASIARILIFASAAINLFMAGLFWLVSQLLPDLAVGEQAEFGLALAMGQGAGEQCRQRTGG